MEILGQDEWWTNEEIAERVKAPLMQLAASYLVNERRGTQAANRVAHFHLSNGARVERLNWLADTSENGIAQSAGLMVNYRYYLQDTETHNNNYISNYVIATSF